MLQDLTVRERGDYFSAGEKLSFALGWFYSLAGLFGLLILVLMVWVGWQNLQRSGEPLPLLMSLDEVASMSDEARVDLEVSVDFRAATRKKSLVNYYWLAEVQGYEGKIYYVRARAHLKGEVQLCLAYFSRIFQANYAWRIFYAPSGFPPSR